MRYARSRALQPVWLFGQLPFLLLSMLWDRLCVKGLIRRHAIDLVLSDGRYGLCTSQVPCVFITHQLRILAPGSRRMRERIVPWLMRLNQFALRGFAEIWVPDFSGSANLSGLLGHPEIPWPRTRYAGPFCRFRPETLSWEQLEKVPAQGPRIDVLALVSGPEPQRSVFEERLIAALRDMPGSRVLVRGLPTGAAPLPADVESDGFTVFNHLPETALVSLLTRAEHVVCRTGYTTVMELAGLGQNKVLMVPTPGQPEQEYLAEHLRGMGWVEIQDQESLDVPEGLKKAGKLPGFAALFAGANLHADRPSLADFSAANPLLSIRGNSGAVL
jgi:hypothetical protein